MLVPRVPTSLVSPKDVDRVVNERHGRIQNIF
jgi:hypothetical protein